VTHGVLGGSAHISTIPVARLENLKKWLMSAAAWDIGGE
jgi:hypothetical protein